MRTIKHGAVMLAAGAMLVAGCGDDDGGSSSDGDDQELIDALTAEGATEEEAECFVDALGADFVERFISASDDEITSDQEAEAIDALEECEVEPDDASGGDLGMEPVAASVEDVHACVEDEGFEISTDSSSPPELDESLGVTDRLLLTARDPEPGTGTIVWYETGDDAEAGFEGAERISTDVRRNGRIGLAVYSFAGADESVEVIESCTGG